MSEDGKPAEKCSCLQLLDKLRLLHEEGKVKWFVAIGFDTDGKTISVQHRTGPLEQLEVIHGLAKGMLKDMDELVHK